MINPYLEYHLEICILFIFFFLSPVWDVMIRSDSECARRLVCPRLSSIEALGLKHGAPDTEHKLTWLEHASRSHSVTFLRHIV
jgi:hypothetical protein